MMILFATHCSHVLTFLSSLLMEMICGCSSSMEIPYFNPSSLKRLRVGEKQACSCTLPVSYTYTSYSSRGLFSSGRCGGAVTGKIVTPLPLRPIPGMIFHSSDVAVMAWL